MSTSNTEIMNIKRIVKIRTITPTDALWNQVANYAENCSWGAGKSLSEKMKSLFFSDWERVIVCLEDDKICGYCTVAKDDCIEDVSYSPYIGYIFVDESHRGNRLSLKMIEFAMRYLKSIGFDRVHIVSDHENLYEKYGFSVVDRSIAPWGEIEKIYLKKL